MKTFLKVALLFFAIVAVLVGVALFLLTRPGFQTRLVEERLPPGSSLGSVQVTWNSLRMSELKLALADGTTVRIDHLETDFKPLDALFQRTLRVQTIQLEGLIVDLQEPVIVVEAEPRISTSAGPGAGAGGAGEVSPPVAAPTSGRSTGSPLDAIYALGRIDWLFEIGSVSIEGEVRDPAGSVFALQLRSDAIRPGASADIEASLRLHAAQELPAGLQEFEASARARLMQKEEGGFEQLVFESAARASDAADSPLLSLNQSLELTVHSFDETASLQADFEADLPQPGLFFPELRDVPGLGVEAAFRGSARGRELTVNEASFAASSAGQAVAALNLKQSFKLGPGEEVTGELMDFHLTRMPLTWLGPWLPDGMDLQGEPLSLSVRFTGEPEPEGSLLLESLEPLQVGPLSILQDGVPLLEEVTLTAAPRFQVNEDQSFSWDLGEIQLMDRYGALLSGQSTGGVDSGFSTGSILPAGIRTSTQFDLGLLELSQQPVLADRFSLLTGRASVSLQIEPGAEQPNVLRGAIRGLSGRELPGLRQDYRFAMQLNEDQPGELRLGLNLEAGAEDSPSTSLQVEGRLRPESEPLEFQIDLTSPRMRQRDLAVLASAFRPGAPAAERPRPVVRDTATAPRQRDPDAGAPVPAASPERPPWSGLDGRFSAAIDAFELDSGHRLEAVHARGTVSEALLDLSELRAQLGEGSMEGRARAEFAAEAEAPYRIEGRLRLRALDPAVFADRDAGAFPVQGRFDGDLSFNGRGQSVEEAVDGVQGELSVSGREGVLTAFELDQRSQLGLIGAGLLGQHLKRPGIAAVAQAVPYFENMPFEHFELKLSRGADRTIRVPKIQFKGASVWIDGSGFIVATSLQDLMNQPLELALELGAKGQLVDYLEALQLLGTDTGSGGFRRWSKSVEIGGTLADPDTSALKRILNDAARQALSRPETKGGGSDATEGEESSTAPKKSKEQKVIDDVETGLDLLNSVFGR